MVLLCLFVLLPSLLLTGLFVAQMRLAGLDTKLADLVDLVRNRAIPE